MKRQYLLAISIIFFGMAIIISATIIKAETMILKVTPDKGKYIVDGVTLSTFQNIGGM